jgi:MFS family permease
MKSKVYGWRWVNVAMMALVSWAGTSTIVSCFQIVPLIMEGLAIGPAIIGLFMIAYLIGMTITSFWAGAVADRIGSKISIVLGMLIAVAGQAIFGASPDYIVAIVGRFLIGVGSMFWFTAAPRLIGMWAGPGELGLHQGIYFGFQFAGSGSAGIIVPMLAEMFGFDWRWAIYIVAIYYLISTIIVAILTKERPPTATDGGNPEPTSVYGSKWVWVYAIFFGGVTAAMYVNLTYGPSYALTVLPLAQASALASAFGWAAFPASICSGLIADKIGKNWPIILIGGICTSCAVLIPITGATAMLPLIAIAYGISGWGPLFGAVPDVSLTVKSAGKYYPADKVGTAMGLNSLCGFGFSIISVYVSGLMAELGYGWLIIFAWATLWGLIAFIASIAAIKAEKGLEKI